MAASAEPGAVRGRKPGAVRGRKPAHGEPVLDRAFRIMGTFGPERQSLSLAELSSRAGLPKPTALRLARRLTELGALERAENGEYAVGLRLLEVASLAPRGHGLRATALPYMEDLHHATGQHVLLAVRDGGEAVLVERLSAHGAGQVMYRVGGRLPLHSTGVGLVLLAHAPAVLQDVILGQDLTLRPENTIRTASQMRAQLASVRRDGVAVASRSWPEPVISVAAPILGRQGGPIAALSVVARAGEAEPAVLRPAIVAVARAISRAVTEETSAPPQRIPSRSSNVRSAADSPPDDQHPPGEPADQCICPREIQGAGMPQWITPPSCGTSMIRCAAIRPRGQGRGSSEKNA